MLGGGAAQEQSGGAFTTYLPSADGSRRRDPSGVVKGCAVYRASRLLAALDDTDSCLSVGGDMVCQVTDPYREAWHVGTENPRIPSTVIAVVPGPAGGGGDVRSSASGQQVLDGRTGRPVQGVAAVTVIGSSLT